MLSVSLNWDGEGRMCTPVWAGRWMCTAQEPAQGQTGLGTTQAIWGQTECTKRLQHHCWPYLSVLALTYKLASTP